MSEPVKLSERVVLHRVPGCEDVRVRRELEFHGAASRSLVFDLYEPLGAARPAPVVVIVEGYPDPGYAAVMGGRFKDMGFTSSWARLIAASGIAAVAATNVEPVADLRALLAHLRGHAQHLGLDPARIGVWTSSGNAPLALSLLLRGADEPIRCAALCYPFLLDLDGAAHTADAAKRFGFANACAGRGIDDLARDVPLLLVRAGRDEMPGLNASLDAFAARALAANLPFTLLNHPEGAHAFELSDGGPATAATVEQVLAFLRLHLHTGATSVNRG